MEIPSAYIFGGPTDWTYPGRLLKFSEYVRRLKALGTPRPVGRKGYGSTKVFSWRHAGSIYSVRLRVGELNRLHAAARAASRALSLPINAAQICRWACAYFSPLSEEAAIKAFVRSDVSTQVAVIRSGVP